MDIHTRIRKRREALGLTMEALGERLNVSWQTVQQWERRTAPKRVRMAEVARALGTTPDWLVFGVGPDPDAPRGQLELQPPPAEPLFSPLALCVAEMMDRHRDDEIARTEVWAYAMRLFNRVGSQVEKGPLDPSTSAEPRGGRERRRERRRA